MSSQGNITAAMVLTALAADPSPTAFPAFCVDVGTWQAINDAHLTAVPQRAAQHAPRARKPNRRRPVRAVIALGFAGYLAARKASR